MATRPELHIAVAKTKSKASEYNDNFDMMMDYCEAVALEDKTYVDNFMPSVTNNGGKFLTTNGTTTSWASLGNQPFGDFINGLVITKSSDDTIAISAGSCYDIAKAVILTNGSSTTKQNESQTASATYYVYIIDGVSTDFLITTESSSPTLPSGSTTYRQIGYYTTDSNSKINEIFSFCNIVSLGTIGSSLMIPDWSKKAGRSLSTTYTAQDNGFIVAYSSGDGNNFTLECYINGVLQYREYNHGQAAGTATCSFILPVAKGDTYRTTGRTDQYYYVPAKGGN